MYRLYYQDKLLFEGDDLEQAIEAAADTLSRVLNYMTLMRDKRMLHWELDKVVIGVVVDEEE